MCHCERKIGCAHLLCRLLNVISNRIKYLKIVCTTNIDAILYVEKPTADDGDRRPTVFLLYTTLQTFLRGFKDAL